LNHPVKRVTSWSIFGPVDTLGQWPFGKRGDHEEDTIYRRADGQDLARGGQGAVSEVAKKHGVSDVTIYAWRKRFGQLEAVDVKRLRALEAENARLKKVLAEKVMDIEVLKDVAAKQW
jgi:putative transposase